VRADRKRLPEVRVIIVAERDLDKPTATVTVACPECGDVRVIDAHRGVGLSSFSDNPRRQECLLVFKRKLCQEDRTFCRPEPVAESIARNGDLRSIVAKRHTSRRSGPSLSRGSNPQTLNGGIWLAPECLRSIRVDYFYIASDPRRCLFRLQS
jgi:hypothetical protein